MKIKNYIAVFKRFERIDRAIAQHLSKVTPNSFASFWVSPHDYQKHLKKRLRRGDIKKKAELFTHAIQTYCHPDSIYYLKARQPQMRDKIFFIYEGWVDIFLDNGYLITSFPLKEDLQTLLNDKKNQNYIHIPIPLTYHQPKKAIICQKRSANAANDSPQT